MARFLQNLPRTVTRFTVIFPLLLAHAFARAADTASFAAPVAAAATPTPGVARVLLSLALVLALLFAGAWAMKRVAGVTGGANARLRTLASLSLGARERAVLIEVDGREVLLGVAPGNVRTLLVGDLPSLKGEGDLATTATGAEASFGTHGASFATGAAPAGAARTTGAPDLKSTFSAILRRSLGR